ncbi:MAG: nitroimidazol reductase NimA-like FMN-containing flavoprotein [Natronomonas sp.]
MEPFVVAMKVRGDLSLDEIETFLGTATIPLRIACRTPSEHLWMVSLWFQYRDGHLYCATSKEADVVRYLDNDGHVAFEVSTNDPPYRGVRGHGSASVTDDPEKEVLRELLNRYLNGTENPLGRRLLSEERDEVTISIEPTRVFGWDFSDRKRGSSA